MYVGNSEFKDLEIGDCFERCNRKLVKIMAEEFDGTLVNSLDLENYTLCNVNHRAPVRKIEAELLWYSMRSESNVEEPPSSDDNY